MEKRDVFCQKISGQVKDFTEQPPVPFTAETELPLVRHWDASRPYPEEPGKAWAGYDETGLRFAAVLKDSDIVTRATENNQLLWTLGDTVEFFVKPGQDQSVYYEIHLSPNGYIMDLRFPSREKFRSKEIPWEEVIAFESHSWYRTVIFEDGWAAEILISWPAFDLSQPPRPGTVWQFAICRYN
ncbi:MAG TPA: carbohydrate-binding family 9-like protein, partial [bacterium]|nr:carbohydrate-binding family 9-like protein [bacterium]